VPADLGILILEEDVEADIEIESLK